MFGPFAAVAAFALLAPAADAGAGFPEARHGAGDLRYKQGVAVLRLRGTPQEIGEQWGVLAVKNAPDVDGLRRRFLEAAGQSRAEAVLMTLAMRFQKGTPPDHLAEMQAASTAAGRPLRQALFANGLFDLASNLGCATVVVDPDKSKTGGALLARNFDWDPVPGLREHTLLAAFSPKGKRSFAVLTFAPISGSLTGMNDAGLACTLNQVLLSKAGDGSEFHWDGTPTLLLARRVLEECATAAEAEKLIRDADRVTAATYTLADPTGGVILEATPKTVRVRKPIKGVAAGTNHFEEAGLKKDGITCDRLPKLLQLRAGSRKLDPGVLFDELNRVNQDDLTLQSMVLDCAAKAIHLKLADAKGPASAKGKYTTFELARLWE